MIEGCIDSNLEAFIELDIQRDGAIHRQRFLVDTGFNGFIAVPQSSAELKATRKPRLLFRFDGSFLLRFADRQFLAELFQLPPRFTRFEPFDRRRQTF